MNALMQPPANRWKRTLHQALRLGRAGMYPSAPETEDLDALRGLCHRLVDDLPPVIRHELVLRILHARNRDDLWHLRSQMFSAISMQFGEHVARERIQRLNPYWG
jgi:hypothetical protein